LGLWASTGATNTLKAPITSTPRKLIPLHFEDIHDIRTLLCGKKVSTSTYGAPPTNGPPRAFGAEPLIHRPFRPDKAIWAGFSGSFARCHLSAILRHHDGDLIRLTRRTVNNPNPAMKSERVVLLKKGAVSKNGGFLRR
jgi:hypothetical protein